MFHQMVLRIVIEQHDVRHFNACVHPNLDAGRQTILNRVLRRPDRRVGSVGVVKCLKIDHADQSAPNLAAGKRSLHKNQAVLICLKHIGSEILEHGLLNPRHTIRFVISAEIIFREHQMKSRRRIADKPLHLCPVLSVRGELIAGNDAPFAQITSRQKDFCRLEY